MVVVHYTVSENLKNTVNWLCDKRARASAHVVIGRDGQVASVVPFDRCAWHAGASSWKGYNGLNNYSIGIELCNWGPLKRSDEGVYTPVGGKVVIEPEDVSEGKHKNGVTQYSFWQKYPDAQIEALDTLLDGLFKDFRSLTEIVGHDDICVPVGRKTDPGPAASEFMTRLKQKHDRY
jgi:N-acetylmuramoyl-L-alanine amidase